MLSQQKETLMEAITVINVIPRTDTWPSQAKSTVIILVKQFLTHVLKLFEKKTREIKFNELNSTFPYVGSISLLNENKFYLGSYQIKKFQIFSSP